MSTDLSMDTLMHDRRDRSPSSSSTPPPPPSSVLAATPSVSLHSVEGASPAALRSPSSPAAASLKRALPVDDDDHDDDHDLEKVAAAAELAQHAHSPSPPSPVTATTTLAHAQTPPTKKVLERNQACLGCRARKRKCDGGKPSCGACERLERECVYSGNAVTKIHSSTHRERSASDAWARMINGDAAPTNGHRYRTSPPASASPPSSAGDPVRMRPSPAPSITLGSSAGHTHTFTPINVEPTHSATLSPPPPLANGRPASKRPSFLDRPIRTDPPVMPGFDAGLFALSFLQASPFIGLESIDFSSMQTTEGGFDNTPRSEDAPKPLPLQRDDLPEPGLMTELFELFFARVHPLLPCLYQKRVMSEIEPGGTLAKGCSLTYSILAIAAHLHPSSSVKAMSGQWNTLAKQQFNAAVCGGAFSVSHVQAGVYTALRMYGTSQMSELWVFLSAVWRMCVPLGLHQLDANIVGGPRGFLPHPRSEQELEERRRTMWAVYLIDRLVTYSVGWSMNINDRDFCVNFPASEQEFQSGSIEMAQHMTIDPFAYNVAQLVPSTHSNPPPRDPYQWLCKLSVLVGQITTQTTSIHSPTLGELEILETTLTRFMLALPKKYRSPSSVENAAELPMVVLLNLLCQCCQLRLHEGRAEDVCERAVDQIVSTLKMVVPRLDPDTELVTLGNVFIGAPLFMAALRLRGDEAKQDLVMGVLGRLEESWPALAGKWKVLLNTSTPCAMRYIAERRLE